MKAQSSVEMDVCNERTDKGDLHYPSRPFGVWHDTLDGPWPYLMDRHSHARCTGALHAALAWARKQPGNGARIYDHVSGRVIARYCQAPSGDLGCLLYSPQGKTDSVCAE